MSYSRRILTWSEVVQMQKRRSVRFAAPTTGLESNTTEKSSRWSSVVGKASAQLGKLDRDLLQAMCSVLVIGVGLRAVSAVVDFMPMMTVTRLMHKGVELGYVCLFLAVAMIAYKRYYGIKVVW